MERCSSDAELEWSRVINADLSFDSRLFTCRSSLICFLLFLLVHYWTLCKQKGDGEEAVVPHPNPPREREDFKEE